LVALWVGLLLGLVSLALSVLLLPKERSVVPVSARFSLYFEEEKVKLGTGKVSQNYDVKPESKVPPLLLQMLAKRRAMMRAPKAIEPIKVDRSKMKVD
jgi:hypothetical protein